MQECTYRSSKYNFSGVSEYILEGYFANVCESSDSRLVNILKCAKADIIYHSIYIGIVDIRGFLTSRLHHDDKISITYTINSDTLRKVTIRQL